VFADLYNLGCALYIFAQEKGKKGMRRLYGGLQKCMRQMRPALIYYLFDMLIYCGCLSGSVKLKRRRQSGSSDKGVFL